MTKLAITRDNDEQLATLLFKFVEMATQAEAGGSLDMAEEPQNTFLIMLALEGNGLPDQLTMGLKETLPCKAKTVCRPLEKVRISHGLHGLRYY
jgi:hypothetical protein